MESYICINYIFISPSRRRYCNIHKLSVGSSVVLQPLYRLLLGTVREPFVVGCFNFNSFHSFLNLNLCCNECNSYILHVYMATSSYLPWLTVAFLTLWLTTDSAFVELLTTLILDTFDLRQRVSNSGLNSFHFTFTILMLHFLTLSLNAAIVFEL